jgi:hypothetical protein
MSEVVVIGDDLRERVAKELWQMRTQFPTSIAAQVRPEHINDVIEAVAEIIDVSAPYDLDVKCLAALGRWKITHPQHFQRQKMNPNAMSFKRKHTPQ